MVSDQESNADEGSSQFVVDIAADNDEDGELINEDNDADGELIDNNNDADGELIDDDDTAENAIHVAASTSSRVTSKSSTSKGSFRFQIEWLTGRS